MKVQVRWILLENYAKQFEPAFPFNPLYQRWQWFGNSAMHHHLPGLSEVSFIRFLSAQC